MSHISSCHGESGVAASMCLKFVGEFVVHACRPLWVWIDEVNWRRISGEYIDYQMSCWIRGREFETYPVCSKCYAIYTKEQSNKTLPEGQIVNQVCSNVLWLKHSLSGEKLMKKVRANSGKYIWYPWKYP